MLSDLQIGNRWLPCASDLSPALEQKVIDRIVDFLWDEPEQLAKCCLVCTAWYVASRRHLLGFGGLKSLGTKRDLDDFTHVLLSSRNERFGRAVRLLDIEDDPEERFVHTLPDRLPGSLLPNVETLNLSQLDWTSESSRPNEAVYFGWLTSFGSVTTLNLEDCRFRHAEDVHSIVDALPKLERLHIDTTVIGGDPPGNAGEVGEHRTRASHLESDGFVTASSTVSSGKPNNSLLPVHPTISCLHVDTIIYRSFSEFQQSMRAFPKLREVLLHGDPAWIIPGPSANTTLLQTDAPIDIWPMLALHDMTAEVLRRFIQLFTTQYRKYRDIYLSLRGSLTPALEDAIEELTRACGPELTTFFWDSCRDKEALRETSLQQVPFFFPSFIQNDNLRSLQLLTVMPSKKGIPWVYRALVKLFSQITSPCLQDIQVQFCLDTEFSLPWAEEDLGEYTATPEASAAFHVLLCRPVFDGIPRNAVRIDFYDWGSTDKLAVQCASAEVIKVMVPLFAPWLERGIVRLELPDVPEIDHSNYRSYGG